MYRRALRGESKKPEDYRKLGSRLFELELYQESAEALRRAIGLEPGGDVYQAALGRTLLHSGQPDAALEPLRAALDISPRSAAFRIQLAKALIASGQREAGIKQLRKTADASPESSWILRQVGDQLEEIGLVEEGRRLLAKSREIAKLPARVSDLGPASSEVQEFLEQHRKRLGLEPLEQTTPSSPSPIDSRSP